MNTLKISVTAGAFMRRVFIRQLKDYCWVHNVECQVEESKGVFDSSFRIKLTGDDEQLECISSWLQKLKD